VTSMFAERLRKLREIKEVDKAVAPERAAEQGYRVGEFWKAALELKAAALTYFKPILDTVSSVYLNGAGRFNIYPDEDSISGKGGWTQTYTEQKLNGPHAYIELKWDIVYLGSGHSGKSLLIRLGEGGKIDFMPGYQSVKTDLIRITDDDWKSRLEQLIVSAIETGEVAFYHDEDTDILEKAETRD